LKALLNGALVPRAAVVINSQSAGEKRDLATDGEGSFPVQFLPPGKYDLTVRTPGFESFILNGVQVQITEVSRLKIQLALGGAKQQIVVSATPPLLQTENATLGRVIDHQTVVDLPLVDRNFTEILGLTAGTSTNVVDATQLGTGSQEIPANGARSGDNNFMLNGVDANSYSSNITEVTPFGGAGIAIPAPDSIQQFKVQTSLYGAQYGRGGGANINLETRSGTADLHGNAYYFGRNEALDANNFFANATGVPREEFRRSQPGGTLRGPIPWSKKRAVFFVSWRTECLYPGDEDWIFAAVQRAGKSPLSFDAALQRQLRHAAIRAGITKPVGWHTFRHSLATLLVKKREGIKVVQELMRHADSRTTLDIYSQTDDEDKRAAQKHISGLFIVEQAS
jgi:hypothetical protein